jgi:hypothetical protein
MVMKKKTPAAMGSPTAAGRITKGTVRAGKSKSDYKARTAQNKGVKDGTIRLGKSGKSYNVWDAKSGTWKRGVVSAASGSSARSGATGTYTKSYDRAKYVTPKTNRVNKTGDGMRLTEQEKILTRQQREREQKRIAARKAK